MNKTEQLIEKMELKELVDRFAILADEKNTKEQALLFTEDASLVSIVGEVEGSRFEGRDAIEKACAGFLSLFHTVCHVNGQFLITELSETEARATHYCSVKLVNDEATNENIAVYDDKFKKVNGEWKVASRTTNFIWSNNGN